MQVDSTAVEVVRAVASSPLWDVSLPSVGPCSDTLAALLCSSTRGRFGAGPEQCGPATITVRASAISRSSQLWAWARVLGEWSSPLGGRKLPRVRTPGCPQTPGRSVWSVAHTRHPTSVIWRLVFFLIKADSNNVFSAHEQHGWQAVLCRLFSSCVNPASLVQFGWETDMTARLPLPLFPGYCRSAGFGQEWDLGSFEPVVFVCFDVMASAVCHAGHGHEISPPRPSVLSPTWASYQHQDTFSSLPFQGPPLYPPTATTREGGDGGRHLLKHLQAEKGSLGGCH